MRKIYKKMAFEDCGLGKALYLIGGKWKMIILFYILREDRNFNELQRLLEDVTPTTLNTNLKELISDDLIEKKIISQNPLRTIYTMTEKGRELENILIELRDFGKKQTL